MNNTEIKTLDSEIEKAAKDFLIKKYGYNTAVEISNGFDLVILPQNHDAFWYKCLG